MSVSQALVSYEKLFWEPLLSPVPSRVTSGKAALLILNIHYKV